jgi:5-deoxy-glucuronate isomerase
MAPSSNLLVHPQVSSDPEVIVEVTPDLAHWETIHFQARRQMAQHSWSFETGDNELALVGLSGSFTVDSNRGRWENIGRRMSVFAGLPFALYLPRQTRFSLTAETDCEFAAAWSPSLADFSPCLVTPADVWVEIRGGDHATRQINSILPPGFPCDRLVVVEVYTPGGNWSSYPPHKHDLAKNNPDGSILEADLDEIYYYRFERSEGYAFQRIYTSPESPLHRAGQPIDTVLQARNNDVVLIPEGYHPVSAPPGYNTYYLNVLAGSAQSLAASDDPAFAWVKTTYRSRDPRVPVYDVSGAAGIR